MSFENAYHRIQRRRIRAGRMGPRRAPALHRPWASRETELVSRVVSHLLLRDGLPR